MGKIKERTKTYTRTSKKRNNWLAAVMLLYSSSLATKKKTKRRKNREITQTAWHKSVGKYVLHLYDFFPLRLWLLLLIKHIRITTMTMTWRKWQKSLSSSLNNALWSLSIQWDAIDANEPKKIHSQEKWEKREKDRVKVPSNWDIVKI